MGQGKREGTFAMSEQDWAANKSEEILFEHQAKTGLPMSHSLKHAIAEGIREARKIEWPLKEQIEAHLTYMGAATERELPVNYNDGFRAGINWVKRLLEDKRK